MPRLVILDDVFPNPASPFRIAEYSSYLRAFAGSFALSTPHNFPTPSGAVGLEASIEEFAAVEPELARRVSLFDPRRLEPADLAYIMFLNNALRFLPALESAQVPFVLTLYPGGGMQLNQPEVDAQLRRVLGHPLFRGVVTTQRVTRAYLFDRAMVDPSRVCHIQGVAMLAGPSRAATPRTRFGFGKDTVDVVFTAHRYTRFGVDKGYDVVVDAARKVLAEDRRFVFHFVGPWESDGYPHHGLQGSGVYHGALASEQLRDLLRSCDVSVAPNRPFMLAPGAYDGCPVSGSVEAGLEGTAVLLSDELGEQAFADGAEVVRFAPDADELAALLLALARDPGRLRLLGETAQAAFRRAYGHGAQIAPRLSFVRSRLAESTAGRRPGRDSLHGPTAGARGRR